MNQTTKARLTRAVSLALTDAGADVEAMEVESAIESLVEAAEANPKTPDNDEEDDDEDDVHVPSWAVGAEPD
jgi:hypothetical protein